MENETKEITRSVCRIFFGLYLLFLIYWMFFAEEWGRSMLSGDYHYNLVPFREIRRYLVYYEQIGLWRVLWNLAGNVVGFMPFGALLPLVVSRRLGFWKTALYSFEMTLLIEISQLMLRVGSCDVDDMILNTLGGCLGYLAYVLLIRPKEKDVEEKKI